MILNERILRLMSPADRAKLGKAGITAAEAAEKCALKDESELQSLIRQYLRLNGVEFINPDMRKKSQLPAGWPDFTFCYRGVPVGAECKIEGEKPRQEQSERLEKMQRNGWVTMVVYSVADIQQLMRSVDTLIDGDITKRLGGSFVE